MSALDVSTGLYNIMQWYNAKYKPFIEMIKP